MSHAGFADNQILEFKAMKVPRTRVDGVSSYKNNVFYIAAPRGGIFASLQQAAGY
jgi:hypothetical protein